MKLKYSEANIQAFFKTYARLSEADFIDLPDYKAIISHNSTWPNSVFSFCMNQGKVSQKIDELIDQMRMKKLPSQLRTPPSIKENVLNVLREKSIRFGTWAAMGMEMSELNVIKNDVDISLVTTDNHLKAWMEIIETELMQGGTMDKLAFQKLLNEPTFKLYLACVNGVPASTALTFVDQNSVGVYLIATAKEFQRRGIGTAITAHSLHALKDKTITHAYLQATDIGMSVYEAVGFKELGKIGGFAML